MAKGGSTGIHIGHTDGSVQKVGETVLAILKSGQEQETIREALRTFKEATKLEASVSHCNIQGPL